MSSIKVTVPLDDYRQLQDVVIDLQTKYNAIVDDKQRWRNFAVLSSATQLLAQHPELSNEWAIARANVLLTLIEGESNGTAGASAGS